MSATCVLGFVFYDYYLYIFSEIECDSARPEVLRVNIASPCEDLVENSNCSFKIDLIQLFQ